MKKYIFLSLIIFIVLGTKAQRGGHFIFGTTIGTRIALSTPESTPFTWSLLGYYSIGRRFSAGIGTGLSFYEKTLIPLFVTAKFTLLPLRKFTPYLECGAGYSFAPDPNANGGFYLNPSVGLQYTLRENKKIFLTLGYELQKLERLKNYENSLFRAEFAEKLRHHSISIKVGFLF